MPNNLSHQEAIKALCDCAATVTVLSYQEVIEGYFNLRGLSIPADRRSSPPQNDAGVEDDAEEAYQIGKREGYEEALADVDRRTGGDGEYFASTIPGRGCPDGHAMMAKVVDRFEAGAEALAYYANDEHYDGGDVPGHIYVLDDHGRTARAALARTLSQKGPDDGR